MINEAKEVRLLRALHPFARWRKHDAMGVCRLFNVRDTADERKELRAAWKEMVGGEEPNVNTMDEVLEAISGIAYRAKGKEQWRLRLVLENRRRMWAVVAADLLTPQQFLAMLRVAFNGRALLPGEAWKLLKEDDGLMNAATDSAQQFDGDIHQQQMYWLLRRHEGIPTNGWVLISTVNRRWTFIPFGLQALTYSKR